MSSAGESALAAGAFGRTPAASASSAKRAPFGLGRRMGRLDFGGPSARVDERALGVSPPLARDRDGGRKLALARGVPFVLGRQRRDLAVESLERCPRGLVTAGRGQLRAHPRACRFARREVAHGGLPRDVGLFPCRVRGAEGLVGRGARQSGGVVLRLDRRPNDAPFGQRRVDIVPGERVLVRDDVRERALGRVEAIALGLEGLAPHGAGGHARKTMSEHIELLGEHRARARGARELPGGRVRLAPCSCELCDTLLGPRRSKAMRVGEKLDGAGELCAKRRGAFVRRACPRLGLRLDGQRVLLPLSRRGRLRSRIAGRQQHGFAEEPIGVTQERVDAAYVLECGRDGLSGSFGLDAELGGPACAGVGVRGSVATPFV